MLWCVLKGNQPELVPCCLVCCGVLPAWMSPCAVGSLEGRVCGVARPS
jgi:hypothetical protein